MRLKSELYKKEQDDITEKIISILDLDNDTEKQTAILDMKEKIQKCFAVVNVGVDIIISGKCADIIIYE